jgi:hypothetical protein
LTTSLKLRVSPGFPVKEPVNVRLRPAHEAGVLDKLGIEGGGLAAEDDTRSDQFIGPECRNFCPALPGCNRSADRYDDLRDGFPLPENLLAGTGRRTNDRTLKRLAHGETTHQCINGSADRSTGQDTLNHFVIVHSRIPFWGQYLTESLPSRAEERE